MVSKIISLSNISLIEVEKVTDYIFQNDEVPFMGLDYQFSQEHQFNVAEIL